MAELDNHAERSPGSPEKGSDDPVSGTETSNDKTEPNVDVSGLQNDLVKSYKVLTESVGGYLWEKAKATQYAREFQSKPDIYIMILDDYVETANHIAKELSGEQRKEGIEAAEYKRMRQELEEMIKRRERSNRGHEIAVRKFKEVKRIFDELEGKGAYRGQWRVGEDRLPVKD